MNPKKVKVPVDQLCVGMYVSELDRPWLGTPFLTQGFPLLGANDIQAVKRECEFVYIDADRSNSKTQEHLNRSMTSKSGTTIPGSAEYPIADAPKVSLFKRMFSNKKAACIRSEITQPIAGASKAFDETRQLVRTVFDDVKLGNSVDTIQAKDVAAHCVDQVIQNPDAMVLLTSIKEKDNYTAEHCLNVSILSIVMGKAVGLDREQLESLGACGLLHDVGKILSPDEVLKKPGRLTPEEFLIMKMHPTQGRDILMSSDNIIKNSIDVAHSHHERLDGTGYPRGLTNDSLSLFTRIVTVVDAYDAITSQRVYDSARSTIEAYKVLQSEGGNHFDSELVSRLIATIGIYPPGSVVQLSNGEIGVVVRANPKRKLLPKVLLLKNSKLKPFSPRYVDLAASQDSSDDSLRIVKQHKASDVGVDLHAFSNAQYLGSLAR